ncbi:head-tail adaptor protein [Vibrio cholerae]|uniref:phage head completion protein n=1 Tax=Vibrio cholerae TaxID=666 RepID=UPI001E618DA2|nr:head-tail adaptor protein [Vibrio cholerae]EGQ9960035.1 head-tail adaptor protein [Vibrio cholerae]EJL6479676.1 head-tail adaptor protein [Vibrio cholerae]EJL6830116.1 head-tail adaptor protein [Vibrio cholerae]EJL7007699.1 head-tail adaptor protein [Vibrio cholerae]EKF9698722.1 head-tail adaptor protein [Vibrio cholerae]
MNFGRMNHRIQWAQQQQKRDEFGETSTELVGICTVCAWVQPKQATRIQNQVEHTIELLQARTRYNLLFNDYDQCYIIFNGNKYKVLTVIDVDYARHEHLITAERVL